MTNKNPENTDLPIRSNVFEILIGVLLMGGDSIFFSGAGAIITIDGLMGAPLGKAIYNRFIKL